MLSIYDQKCREAKVDPDAELLDELRFIAEKDCVLKELIIPGNSTGRFNSKLTDSKIYPILQTLLVRMRIFIV